MSQIFNTCFQYMLYNTTLLALTYSSFNKFQGLLMSPALLTSNNCSIVSDRISLHTFTQHSLKGLQGLLRRCHFGNNVAITFLQGSF